jgi:hypothetical protein
MKELRPGSTGRTEVRVLFPLDPKRRAVLLVGGDKSSAWSKWYEVNVPIADERYDAHLRRLKDVQSQTEGTGRRKGR